MQRYANVQMCKCANVAPQGLLRGCAFYGGDVWNVAFYTAVPTFWGFEE